MDTARAEKLKINFDIDFPRMPCLCESMQEFEKTIYLVGVAL